MPSSPREAVGLSVLDLVSGLVGLLVLLYVLSNRNDGLPGTVSQPLQYLEVQAEHDAPYPLGLSFVVDGTRYTSWPECTDAGPVRWVSCQPGRIAALVEDSKVEGEYWILVLSGYPNFEAPDHTINVMVTAPTFTKKVGLTRSKYYRSAL